MMTTRRRSRCSSRGVDAGVKGGVGAKPKRDVGHVRKPTHRRLRVELHAEEWLRDVNNALVREVVSIDEERLPVRRKGVVVDSKAVVLR